MNGPPNFLRHRNGPIEVERLGRPAFKNGKAVVPRVLRYLPNIGQFPRDETSQKLSNGNLRSRPYDGALLAHEPKIGEMLVNLVGDNRTMSTIIDVCI